MANGDSHGSQIGNLEKTCKAKKDIRQHALVYFRKHRVEDTLDADNDVPLLQWTSMCRAPSRHCRHPDALDCLVSRTFYRLCFLKEIAKYLKTFFNFFPLYFIWEMLYFPNFYPQKWFPMMCHHLMKWWHIFQNDKSHEIVTHHLGTKFWEKNLGCVALPISYCRS
jgi:hypothetical protein